jgi:hypothetical protein
MADPREGLLTLVIDPEASALLQRAVNALVAAEMERTLELLGARIYGRGRALDTEWAGETACVLKMKPFVELLLFELITIAQAPGFPVPAREERAVVAMTLAGF